jgi:hypothetical protein
MAIRCPMDGGIMDREIFAWEEPPISLLVARPVTLEARATSWVDTCRRCEWERVVGQRARQHRREERHGRSYL